MLPHPQVSAHELGLVGRHSLVPAPHGGPHADERAQQQVEEGVHEVYRVRGARHDNTDVDEQVAEQSEHHEQERGVERARHEARPLLELVRRVVPVVPRYAVRTARPRLVRIRCTYSAWRHGSKLPCAPGRYSTPETDTRIPYVQYGGPGAYV